MLYTLQSCYQAPQGLSIKATPDFDPAFASQNNGQLGTIAGLRRHLDCHPLRSLMPNSLLPAIPSQVSRQCLQGHSALLAEFPLAREFSARLREK
jgi:hypothetical protein